MSENNNLLKGIPTPKSTDGAPSTDTGNVSKINVQEEDDTRTRKTVKLSAAGMMPNIHGAGRLSPENLAISPSVPSAPGSSAIPKAPMMTESPTVKLRPIATPNAATATAPSTDTGSVPKQSAEDTRTRRTVRITAASVEDTVKLQRSAGAPATGATPPAMPSVEPVAATKPKLSMPTPAKPVVSAPTVAAPAAAAAAPTTAPDAPGNRRERKEKATLNLKKEEGEKTGPSRVNADMQTLSGKKTGSNEVSSLYTVLAVITVIALVATVVLSSQYLNVWSPEWAGDFTILPNK